jgi:hypothetical protein
MALSPMTLPRPWWCRLSRMLSPAFLVGLILVAGTADVLIPAVVDVSRTLSEMDETISSPVDSYCRIRRDNLSDLRLTLFARTLCRVESSASRRSTFGLFSPPHVSSSSLGEHCSCLTRRSRAPGLRAA